MEISQLRYFLKVAERKNFTRAGEELAMTQPALSRSIAKLEEEIGQPVFERQTRMVALTDAGRLLQARAEQILGLIDDTLAEITDDGETGRIRVGAIPTIAPYFLPAILRDFRDQHPRANVLVHEETTEKLLQRCNQGEIDVAILAAPIPRQYLEVEQLFEEELLLVLPVGHPLGGKRQITVADIRNHPFVLLDETHCLSETITSFCRHRSFQPVMVERTSQLATVEELVALGHGVSLIPQMARDLDHSDRRIYRTLSGPKPFRTIVLVWNPYRFQSRVGKRFKECVRNAAKRRGEPGRNRIGKRPKSAGAPPARKFNAGYTNARSRIRENSIRQLQWAAELSRLPRQRSRVPQRQLNEPPVLAGTGNLWKNRLSHEPAWPTIRYVGRSAPVFRAIAFRDRRHLLRSRRMSSCRPGFAFVVLLGSLVREGVAAEPILLRYKFAKGDQLVYRSTHEEKQVQTIAGQKMETTTNQEAVSLQVVDEIDGDGNAIVKTKVVRRKRKSDGAGGKFEFDSKSNDRDTASEAGAAATPLLERLTGSEYQIKVTPRGYVSEVKGYAETIADLVKDKPAGPVLAGIIADNEGQKLTEQEHFLVFSEKPVAPGDNWEYPYDVPLKGIGRLKGKVIYTYEADDKVGARKTVRIGARADLTFDLDLEIMGAKLTGTMTTTAATGTVQFDPAAGRIVSSKNSSTMSGPLKLEAGGMTFDLGSSQDDTTNVQLLDELPE